jgi:hypothetical protein
MTMVPSVKNNGANRGEETDGSGEDAAAKKGGRNGKDGEDNGDNEGSGVYFPFLGLFDLYEGSGGWGEVLFPGSFWWIIDGVVGKICLGWWYFYVAANLLWVHGISVA